MILCINWSCLKFASSSKASIELIKSFLAILSPSNLMGWAFIHPPHIFHIEHLFFTIVQFFPYKINLHFE